MYKKIAGLVLAAALLCESLAAQYSTKIGPFHLGEKQRRSAADFEPGTLHLEQIAL